LFYCCKLNKNNWINIKDEELDILNGEAQVVEVHGDKVGAYRDARGKLYFVNTTCTHMGCELNWNNEKDHGTVPAMGLGSLIREKYWKALQ